ncbi:hypothetical protein F2P56_022869 [Juglans regia]|uniref:UPF0481 protein At3g47200-like isoform X2 n=2 Tax=Juglans regia TaxID=51240 RepID=A0A2I4DXV9_JUGRE|nr:UPF0481 protein At3g47200-like isoform X2 [Juglans regia]KAF5458874.1 hypothetical protein F2P56_022869 [Juglans regia]
MGQSYGTYFQRNDQNASADQEEHLVIRITQLLENSRHHYLPGECCIYKVPYHLHKLNEEAYTPQVISIGPFHHGKKKFQILEKYKVRYLDDFMRRAETNLENLVRIVKGSEAAIHQCYAETIELDSDEFVTMILLDAAFIIEYFLRDMFPMQWTDEDRTVIKPWITARMQLDFLLLENQLPFFILNDLYQLVLVTHSLYRPFTEVASRYFGFLNTQNKSSDSYEFNGIIHFVDLIRIFYLPPPGTLSERRSDSKVEKIYCATQLAEAGLTFKKSESQCYLDLKYHEGGKDVALLAEKNILVNGMGDDNATFINNLGTNVQYSSMNPEYCRLCRDIVEFHDSNWNRWKAILKRDHFSTPWRVVATIAAILLLAFTLTQAVCSIISVLPSKRRNL